MNRESNSARPNVVLVLQGGGALGAYHVGAFQALDEAGLCPDWVTGISIGAVNAALIAGNAPGDRLERLIAFWNTVATPVDWGAWLEGPARRAFNAASAGQALLFGQPGFFTPRPMNPWLALPGAPYATSFYDTAPLRTTLTRLVDFDRINGPDGPRLSLGATRVTTGELVFFDSLDGAIGPEHVMASGALPPGFPAVDIGGVPYWDGGCVSNTPLDPVLADPPAGHTLVFVLDLWSRHGAEPQTMDAVLWRQKQIQYAGRTLQQVVAAAERCQLRYALGRLAAQTAPEMLALAGLGAETRGLGTTRFDFVHLVYHPAAEEVAQSDAEFSRASIEARRAAGYREMREALARAPWREPVCAGEHVGAAMHRIEDGRVSTGVPAAGGAAAHVFTGAGRAATG